MVQFPNAILTGTSYVAGGIAYDETLGQYVEDSRDVGFFVMTPIVLFEGYHPTLGMGTGTKITYYDLKKTIQRVNDMWKQFKRPPGSVAKFSLVQPMTDYPLPEDPPTDPPPEDNPFIPGVPADPDDVDDDMDDLIDEENPPFRPEKTLESPDGVGNIPAPPQIPPLPTTEEGVVFYMYEQFALPEGRVSKLETDLFDVWTYLENLEDDLISTTATLSTKEYVDGNFSTINTEIAGKASRTYVEETFYTQEFINNNFYTKIATDSAITLKASKTYVDQTFYTQEFINNNFYTKTALDSILLLTASKHYVDTLVGNLDIPTQAEIQTIITGMLNDPQNSTYATLDYVNSTFSTLTAIGTINDEIALKASKTYVDSTFYTQDFINSQFYTKTVIDGTVSAINAEIALKASKTYVDSTFYTKDFINSQFYTKTVIDGTVSAINAEIALKASKTYVDARFNQVPVLVGNNNFVGKNTITGEVEVVGPFSVQGTSVLNSIVATNGQFSAIETPAIAIQGTGNEIVTETNLLHLFGSTSNIQSQLDFLQIARRHFAEFMLAVRSSGVQRHPIRLHMDYDAYTFFPNRFNELITVEVICSHFWIHNHTPHAQFDRHQTWRFLMDFQPARFFSLRSTSLPPTQTIYPPTVSPGDCGNALYTYNLEYTNRRGGGYGMVQLGIHDGGADIIFVTPSGLSNHRVSFSLRVVNNPYNSAIKFRMSQAPPECLYVGHGDYLIGNT